MNHPTIKELMAGNARVAGSDRATSRVKDRRPVAAILSCTDERVVPQAIFDQPAGRLYMVRIAGNVYTHEVAGSLEIAVLRLNCPLIVVLGHTDCTAVQMAHSHEWFDGHAYDISRRIRNATAGLPAEGPLEAKIDANVRGTVQELREASRHLRERVDQGKLTIAGAVVNLKSGRVKMLPQEY